MWRRRRKTTLTWIARRLLVFKEIIKSERDDVEDSSPIPAKEVIKEKYENVTIYRIYTFLEIMTMAHVENSRYPIW